jgi:glycosyltransferase involved in cell wall biosynthesis
MGDMRVAYTLEQCWHDAPGGTAVAAIEVARRLAPGDDVDLVGVAARHRTPPSPPWRAPIPVAQLPWPRPLLYEGWLRVGHPLVERATGPVDVAHATGLVPCATRAPLVVTMHDVAWVHEPGRYTRQGLRVMRRSLDVARERATAVVTSSESSRRDLEAAGMDPARVHVVPLGVDHAPAPAEAVNVLRRRLDLPARFALFVGTLEPRKNLPRLAAAMARLAEPLPLVVAGPDGWGDVTAAITGDVRFLGFVPAADLPALYASATLFAYPSEAEGFGLPILEAMAQGTPVVTSAGTSTEEVAGGAAVLVDPRDVDAIAAGIDEAQQRAAELSAAGRRRAAEMTWDATARRTVDIYRAAAGGHQ